MGSLSLDLTIPANTTQAAPVIVQNPIGPGKIKSIKLQFPAGCQYLARVQINIAAFGNARQPIVPSQASGNNALDYVALDNDVQDFPLDLVLKHTTILYAYGWNTDATNQHEVKVVINLE